VTLRVRLGDTAPNLAAFGCSPAHEVLRSLHVLSDVKHHPLHISWAMGVRARMRQELRGDADRLAFWCLDRPLTFPGIWPPGDVGSWPEELAALRKAPIEDFADQLIHGALISRGHGPRIPLQRFLSDTALQEQALTRIQERHPASLPVMRELIADPDACREWFAAFLDSYWQTCIEPDWPDLEAHLLADISRHGRTLSRDGLLPMLVGLSPHLHADPATGDLLIQPPGPAADTEPLHITLAEHDQLLLIPSHFVWPELVAAVHRHRQGAAERQTILITYSLAGMRRQGQPPVPPQDLLQMLRSAGDPTRLQILRLLAQRPCSAREIAGLIGLTEAAISKHLKLLHQAGWVDAERRSYYLYHHLIPDSLEKLTTALEQLLAP
jgi:DNA-binding transcriptional ArsR family regulator